MSRLISINLIVQEKKMIERETPVALLKYLSGSWTVPRQELLNFLRM
jgi:hypothetical protein